jgi:Protein of unknown function (DUF2752)
MAMSEPPEQSRPAPRASSLHWDILLICTGVVLASVVLDVDTYGRMVLPFLPSHPLPATCLTRVLFHVHCPTCGLTRSFIAMAHGEWAEALRFHRLGPFLFAFVFLQVPVRAYAILRGIPPGRLLPRTLGRLVPWLIIGAFIVNWAYDLATGAAFGG